MASNKRDLKAYVRYDGNGRLISGSLILQRFKPKVGNWVEIDAYECCNPTTSTTSTTTSVPTTTSTTTTQCLSKIGIAQNYGTIVSVSVNGVPVTVVSGSLPRNAGDPIVVATTNQSGSCIVEIVHTGVVGNVYDFIYDCGPFGSGQSSTNYTGNATILVGPVNINCGCVSFVPPYNAYITNDIVP